jgi:hypothetical protein
LPNWQQANGNQQASDVVGGLGPREIVQTLMSE